MKYTTNKLLKEIWENSGLNKTDFCELVDMSMTNLRYCFKGELEIRFSTVDRALSALDYKIEFKIRKKDEKQNI